MRAEFCIFESNAHGLKANFYEPCVDMPIYHYVWFNAAYSISAAAYRDCMSELQRKNCGEKMKKEEAAESEKHAVIDQG